MPYPLDDCRSKLERAHELLHELAPTVEELLREWYTPEKCIPYFDEETRLQIVRMPPCPEIPIRWRVIVGEVVGHLCGDGCG
jgi:hypothetical protein